MSWEARPKIDVTLGIAYTGLCTMEWCFNFAQLYTNLHASGRRFYLAYSRGAPIDIARNNIVNDALSLNSEWLLFIDADCLVPPNIFERLVSKNLPIVSGLYYRRHKPIHPAMWKLIPKMGICPQCNREFDSRIKGKYNPIVEYERGSLVECDVIGMGAVLIHRRVLEAVHHPPDDPLFIWTAQREGQLKDAILNNVIDHVGTSEDFYACEKIKNQGGFKLYCATDVIVPHETMVKIVPPEQMSVDDVKYGGIQFPGA